MADSRTTAGTLTPPPPPSATRPSSMRAAGVFRRLPSDCLYLSVGFAAGIITFVVMVTGLALGVGLAITFAGLPILAATLHLAGVAAAIERVCIATVLDVQIPDAVYGTPPPASGRIAQLWTVVSDPQRWSEVAHGLVRFPVATFTWALAVTWWALALAGLAYPVFVWALPQGPHATGLAELLGLQGSAWDIGLNFAIGVFAALSLPWAMRGLAVTQASVGRALLVRKGFTSQDWTGR